MATPGRRTLPPLIDQLFETGHRFQFHAAMKLLGGIHYTDNQLPASLQRFQEKVIIKTNPSFSYVGTDIFKITRPTNISSAPEMYVNFFGIDTRQGPLPDPYIEQMIEYQRANQSELYDFLSVFNTRLLHALHDIRKKYWIGIETNLPETTPYGKTLGAFCGVDDLPAPVSEVPHRTFLFYSGLLWQKPRSKTGLAKILTHFLKLPVTLQEFMGSWTAIPKDQQTFLGTSGQFQILGQGAIVGQKFWDQQKTIGLKILGMSLVQLKSLLKTTILFQQVCSIIHFYLGNRKDFHLELHLQKEEVPPTLLGKGTQLGWTSFLQKTPGTTAPPPVTFDSRPFIIPGVING